MFIVDLTFEKFQDIVRRRAILAFLLNYRDHPPPTTDQASTIYLSERHCLTFGNSTSPLSRAFVETTGECDGIQVRSSSVSHVIDVPLHDDKALQISDIVFKHRLHHCLPHVLLTKPLDGYGTSVRSREHLTICALESDDVESISDAKFILKVLSDHVEQLVSSGDVGDLDHARKFFLSVNVESELDVCQ